MTAARLEELARVCDVALADNDATHLLADEIRDLARCARGWAKVERLLVDHPGSSITIVLGNKSMICLNVHNGTTGATAMECIEAVEAAEVGK